MMSDMEVGSGRAELGWKGDSESVRLLQQLQEGSIETTCLEPTSVLFALVQIFYIQSKKTKKFLS
jgi:hypothetical protein